METSMTTTSQQPTRHAEHLPRQEAPSRGGQHEAGSQITTLLLFVVGCLLLIGCALAITHLGGWADDYGQVFVFVAFFIVMSLAGRWFWFGADTALTWVKSRITQ